MTGSRCPDTTTDLSRAEATSILEPYFVAAQEVFVAFGYDKCAKVRFSVSSAMHDSPRHFAACSGDGARIICAPELAELPEHFVIGIMFHELGHAADLSMPGYHYFGANGITLRRRDSYSDHEWRKIVRAWDERDYDTVERTADSIANMVSGLSIGYAGPCQLQTFEAGEDRPTGLR